jgi:hypothetical protein
MNGERSFGEEIAILWRPRFGQNSLTGLESVVGPATRKVAAVDMQLGYRSIVFDL